MNKIRFIKWGEIPRLGSNKNERMLISFDLKEHRFVKMKNHFKGQRVEEMVVAALLLTAILGSFDHFSDISMHVHWIIGIIVGLLSACAFHFKHQNNPADFEAAPSETVVKKANHTLLKAAGTLVVIDALLIALYFFKKCLGTCLLVYFVIFITVIFAFTFIEMGYVWVRFVLPHKYEV